MATINGNILESPFQLDETFLSPELSEFAEANFPVEVEPPVAGLVAAPVSIAAPLSFFHQTIGGAILPTFADLFFNRIHVLPVKINVGNLANKQTRQIEIFNAWIAEGATLENVTPNGELSGVDFAITPPVVFAPLQSFNFELTINEVGAPNFNGFYEFDFGLKTAPNLTVLGRRIILFPFSHNWENLPSETLEYLTAIFESRADYEQGQKLRPFPRRRLKYFHTPIESGELLAIAENRAELEALLYLWMHRVFALPIWEDLVVLVANLPAGSTEVSIATAGLDYDAGSYIVFWKNSGELELIEIESVTSSLVTLARPTENDWNIGTLILPARLARLAAQIELSGETEEHLQFETEWMLEPNQQSINRIGTFSAPTYRGFPVVLSAFRMNETFQTQLTRKQTLIDYETGGRTVLASGANPRGRFPLSLINLTRTEQKAFYAFLEARSGKLNPCWFPSWQRDFQLLATAGSGATSIVVKGNRFSNIYGADYDNFGFNRRDLLIRWLDGTNFFVRVLSAAPVDEQSETLLLNAALPKELTVSQLDCISFLKFARFESDNIEIVKETINASRAEINLRELVAAE